MKYSLLFTFLFSIVFFENTFSQEKNLDNIILKVIQNNGLKFLKNKNINSVSIGIYKDNQFYTEHFGEIEKGKGIPPNDETIYEIGSVTKTVTGYLAANATLEGIIKLEDDIRLYLKGDYSNLEYNGKPITIENLLTHTSGLPMFLPLKMNGVFEKLNESTPENYLEIEKSYDKEKFLEDLKTISITTEPGTNYAYSNVGAELMGYILETVYKKNIDDLLKEGFYSKYKMLNTGIKLDSIQKEKLVRGYWMDNEVQSPNQFNSLWGTAGGMKMTIMDMLRYTKLQLNSKNQIISESHKALFEVRSPLQIAYYWRIWEDVHGTSYNHHGGTSGTQNWVYIFPKYNLGISIMTNQSGPKTPNLLSKTVNKILKELTKKYKAE